MRPARLTSVCSVRGASGTGRIKSLVTRAIRFFLEPDGYVTGQVLIVDGGLTLRRDVVPGR